MFSPSNSDIPVSKNAPFPSEEWSVALDLTDQRILMQVRLYDGAADPPLIDLSSDDSSGDYIDIITIDTAKPETVFRPIVRQVTHEALPGPGKAGASTTFYYDLRIGPDGEEEVYAYGQYIVRTGVTR